MKTLLNKIYSIFLLRPINLIFLRNASGVIFYIPSKRLLKVLKSIIKKETLCRIHRLSGHGKIIINEACKIEGEYLQLNKGCEILLEKNSTLKFQELKLGKMSFIRVHPNAEVFIGKNAQTKLLFRLSAKKKITIGDNFLASQYVSIWDHDGHKITYEDGTINKPLEIKIANNVWVGHKATILKGVNIEENVVIGAHALVNKDIKKNTIATGIPATPKKKIKKWDA